MKRTLFFVSFLLIGIAAKAQLFINEISQGASGNKDYLELVVAGTRSCTDSTMDLRGIIVDDNAGWYGTGSFNEGCFRFPANSNWSAVPYGSVILVYRSEDKNPSITLADDPTDADHDYVYVVADTSSYLEVNAEPAVMSSLFDYSTALSGSWSSFSAGVLAGGLSLDDSTDVVSIINPSLSTTYATHSIGWGWLAIGGTQTPAISFAGTSGSGFNLYHTGNSPADATLWATGIATDNGPNDETPGAGNTGDNITWIAAMRTPATAPSAPVAIAGPATLCLGATATYTIAPVDGATSYQWNLPSAWTGASTDTSITVTVMSAGAFSVAAQNACGSSATTTFNVAAIVAPLPTTISGSTTLCAGSTENYSIATAGISDIVWTMPQGWSGLSNGGDINCNVGSISGTLSAVVTNVCGTSTTLALPVTVNAYITPSVSISTTNNTICSGVPTIFNASPVNGGPAASYQWLINGALAAGSGSSFSIGTLQSGDAVSAILTSNEECLTVNDVASNQITMTVLPTVIPTIQVTALPATTICQGATVGFITSVTNGGTTPSYQWYQNGQAIPGATASRYSTNVLKNGDAIYAAVISSAVCPSKDTMPGNSIMITVNPIVNPTVKITANAVGATITFTASQTGGGAAPDFQWLVNGKTVPFETAAVYVASNLKLNDTVSVRMTSHDLCPSSSVVTSNGLRVGKLLAAGIDQTNNADASLRVFPNPNNGQFTVDVDYSNARINEPVMLEVLNVMGQVVYRTELQLKGTHSSSNISLGADVSKGMYQVRLHGSKMQASRQLLVQ